MLSLCWGAVVMGLVGVALELGHWEALVGGGWGLLVLLAVPRQSSGGLPPARRRCNNSSSWQRGAPYPLAKLLYPAHLSPPTRPVPLEGWATFRDTHLTSPREAAAAKGDSMDPPGYIWNLETCLREAHRWHVNTPSPQSGKGKHVNTPSPQSGQGRPPARTRTRPRRPKQAKGPVNAPANRTQHPRQDRGRTTLHHPTSRTPIRTTISNTLPIAHSRHRTATTLSTLPVPGLRCGGLEGVG